MDRRDGTAEHRDGDRGEGTRIEDSAERGGRGGEGTSEGARGPERSRAELGAQEWVGRRMEIATE